MRCIDILYTNAIFHASKDSSVFFIKIRHKIRKEMLCRFIKKMDSKMQQFRKPKKLTDKSHKQRRAGFELEFGNKSVRKTAEALHRELGGDIEESNAFMITVKNSSMGTLTVVRDAQLLNSARYRQVLANMNIEFNPGKLASEIEQGVDSLSSVLIPCEIVTEPLLFEDFSKLNDVVRILNALNAEGTQASIFYAFGLHINPSAPDLEPATLVSYLQAYLLLVDWIIETSGTDFTRRFFTSFIDPFPSAYFQKILVPDYHPTVETFIDDYLEFNPTRNRGLDILPILCEIDCDRVRAGLAKEEQSLVSGRPAFHYRLPDCRLGDENWSIADEWNRWWYVEAIAADNGLRKELIDRWNENNNHFFLTRKTQWIHAVSRFLDNLPDPKEAPHE